jgi:hypothetical protein
VKTIIALTLMITVFASGGQALVGNAEPMNRIAPVEVTPMLTLLSTLYPTLSVSGTTASYALTVTSASSVTSITAVLQLQKKNSDGSWSDYGSSWTASSTSSVLYTSGTKTVASGYTYRLKATVTATDGTITGSATVYSS